MRTGTRVAATAAVVAAVLVAAGCGAKASSSTPATPSPSPPVAQGSLGADVGLADYLAHLGSTFAAGCLSRTPASSPVQRTTVSGVHAIDVSAGSLPTVAMTANVTTSTHLGDMPTIAVSFPVTVVAVTHDAELLSLLRIGGSPSLADLTTLVTMATTQAGW